MKHFDHLSGHHVRLHVPRLKFGEGCGNSLKRGAGAFSNVMARNSRWGAYDRIHSKHKLEWKARETNSACIKSNMQDGPVVKILPEHARC